MACGWLDVLTMVDRLINQTPADSPLDPSPIAFTGKLEFRLIFDSWTLPGLRCDRTFVSSSAMRCHREHALLR
jgi:hypothetical protein